MLNHYSLLLEIARERQQEILQQAETERLYKQLTRKRGALLRRLVNRLLTTAKQWPINPQSNPTTPILGGR